MNSFMFTFSANQASLQLTQEQKQQGCLLQTFRRRPTSSSMSKQGKSRKASFHDDQLFDKPHCQAVHIQESPEKGMSSLRIKNSSMQLQEKKKIRNMIDTMLGKNFEMQSNQRLDSIMFTNRKNLNKQRSYLTGTKKYQQESKDLNGNEFKQNHPNDHNINEKSLMKGMEVLQKANKSKLKFKKFQFAAIKISKKTQYSQRYDMGEKEEEIEENRNQNFVKRRCINVSRESIDRESLDKKLLKSKTPKIMYPESDSKLPSIFRTNKHKNPIGESLKKQKRISSAHCLSDTEDKIIEEEEAVIVRRKSTLENQPMRNEAILRSRFRPKSTKIQGKICSKSQYQSGGNKNVPSQFNPKRLVFDTNQQPYQDIKRRLISHHIENANVTRRATRAQSTHCKFVFHKLRDINQNEHMNVFQENGLIKNDSTETKETVEESTLQSFNDASLQNINEDLVDSMELRQLGLGFSVTFQVNKS